MRGTVSSGVEKRAKDLLVIILLSVWAVGALSLFRAEISALGLMPSILRMTEDKKNYVVSGPIYDLVTEASLRIPAESPIYLLTPPDEAEAGVAVGKARYYLYPRIVIEVPGQEAGRLQALSPGDYLMLYMPAKYADSSLEGLLFSLNFSKVYGYSDAKGLQGIYRKGGM